jgi:beta-N-acetylhexosaminidase
MKALRNKFSIEEIAERALLAGNNMLLYCNEPESPVIALEHLYKRISEKKVSAEHIEASYQLVLSLKKDVALHVKPMDFKSALEIIGQAKHKSLAQNIVDGIVPKNLSESA